METVLKKVAKKSRSEKSHSDKIISFYFENESYLPFSFCF